MDYLGIRRDKEWIKWLSYISMSEYYEKQKLYNTKCSLLSDSDLEKVIKYRNNDKMLSLLIKYNKKLTTESEKEEVMDFLFNNSVDKIMYDKINYNSLLRAKEKIDSYIYLEDEVLEEYLKEKIKDYDYLDIEDAFVLNQLIKIYNDRVYFKNKCKKFTL